MTEANYICPKCKNERHAPFKGHCAVCDFNIDHLSGKRLSDFQTSKYLKHTQLLHGSTITLTDSDYNASFDHNGDAKLEQLIQFTISYGKWAEIPSRSGQYTNPVIVSYVPEIIGAGTSIYEKDTLLCSGICIMSPQSYQFGHPFPVLDEWVNKNFNTFASTCSFCRKPTQFGQPFCHKCYQDRGSNWLNLI